ncbi:MAG: hypothetical protein J1E43_08185 [Christensenellaceae bacterium]|nr:hypothetical protein [Christensenellaceae bacterium]
MKRCSADLGQGNTMDYIAFLEVSLAYENGRSVFHLKADLGTEYMPAHSARGTFSVGGAAS